MKFGNNFYNWRSKLYAVLLLLSAFFYVTEVFARVPVGPESQTVLFNNLPRVVLLVKEQYVDPKRINPDAMLASILESLESRITKLVVTLPKTLEKALEQAKASDEQTRLSRKPLDAKPKAVGPGREKLILDLGGVKRTFEFEPQKSIWGMIFLLRQVFTFVETEAKKQRLTEKSSLGEEPIDWEKLEEGAINALLSTLDPHSVYLKPEFARDLTLTTQGKFGGVGIVISVRDGFLTVISPMDGTPASLAGVKAKDRIIKIDDDSAINMDLNEAVNLLRGNPDSTVRVTAQRQNSSKDLEFVLKRAIIKVESVAYALIDNNVGYLRIKAFQGNTVQDVKDGILAMKKKSNNQMSGLVFDLRGNPGGLLREAVDVSSLFLDGGEVVSTQGARPDSRQVEMASAGELDPNLKIVVLADSGSASASEIVAGALKNGGMHKGRGIVVGERTFGKGSVQMLFDFPVFKKPVLKDGANKDKAEAELKKPDQPAALKLTIAEYFGPNHTSIQTIGVSPDIGLAPVYADKREELKLFPEVGTREVDLEGHLATEKKSQALGLEEKPMVNIEYLAPKPNEESVEYGKLNEERLKQDFAVTVATEFIKAAKGNTRADLLASANIIRDRIQKQEQKKISEALAKYKIDWSSGQTNGNASIVASVSENKPVVAGNKLKIAIKVKNNSTEPLYQVHGISNSKTQLFDQKEFLFGKLAPGQEIERFVEFEIPKDVVSRRDLMSVEIRDVRREKIKELDIPLEIKGLKRPRLAHLVYVDDSKTGNGDGKLQHGEDVELTVWLKNVGDGAAFEPTVVLKNESGSKVFLKSGRAQSKELLPNQQTAMKFAFRVKEPTDKVNFEIQIFDGKMHDLWRDKITVNTAPVASTKAYARTFLLKAAQANLLERPKPQSKVIATLREGLRVESTREINDYVLVKVDNNLAGFVKKSDLVTVPSNNKSAPQDKSHYYTLQFDRTPAEVSLKLGDASGIVRTESGTVHAEINRHDRLSALLLYVNGKKVLYKDIKPLSKEKIEQVVHLKPGINVITLFASEDTTYGQRESITVFYDENGRASPPPVSIPTVKEANVK